MSELNNSKRVLNRATYTPIKPVQKEVPPSANDRGRAVDKWTAVAAMGIRQKEIEKLRRRLVAIKSVLPLLDIIERAYGSDGSYAAATQLGILPALANVSARDIEHLGEALIELRGAQHQATSAAVAQITSAVAATLSNQQLAEPPVKPPKGAILDQGFVSARFPGARLYRKEEITQPKVVTKRASARKAAARTQRADPNITAGSVTRQQFTLMLDPNEAAAGSAVSLASLPLTFGGVSAITTDEKLRQILTQVRESMSPYVADSALEHMEMATVSYTTSAAYHMATDALHAFRERLKIEPVGYLHLERIGFTPAGIERGELVYSVPLSPGEEVNITHKEWSNTSEEFERIVTDYQEAYSEEGVSEKSELTQATSSQQQHTSGFNMSVTASGGYGPVTISASAGYNASDSATSSQQFSRNQSNELTRKASARTKKEHKVSFKVASASGTEDQAVRVIKNPFADRATRADYYQLIRKWRVDLFRYGIRLTYDITIPEPGSDILSKIVEIRVIQAALGQGFGTSDASLTWAHFELLPSSVTRSTYATLAAAYGVAVEPPPADEVRIVKAFSRQWSSFDESKHAENNAFDIEVDGNYYVSSVTPSLVAWWWEDEGREGRIETDVSHWIGASGRFTINVFSWQLSSFTLEVIVIGRLKAEIYEAWQMRAWGAMRDAAQARYEMNRANLKARLAQLQEDLGSQDALSLRKIEREEVAKGVLRWLFGPSFNFVPPGLPADLYGPSESIISPDIWARVTAQGEMIKFLHHAIEWENMLYFLYPYFWSHTSRWELKKYLDHPDFMHRTFLRSGSARVVLTVRPGFEKDFVSFIDGGVLGTAVTSRYLTIAQEMEAYAKTNYPGIRPANPVEDARPLLTPLQRRAWDEMQRLIGWLEAYKTDHGAYPTTVAGLAALASYGTVPAADPWGRPYVYRSPGRINDFELLSLGEDGVEGGTDENGDINSWAEASLIGRWFEYTPTSALDIAFNETLPSA